MRYLKTYENINRESGVGDYVIINLEDRGESYGEIFTKYVETHIGKIININAPFRIIQYEDKVEQKTPETGGFKMEDTIAVFNREILHFGRKDEMEMVLIANKYNL